MLEQDIRETYPADGQRGHAALAHQHPGRRPRGPQPGSAGRRAGLIAAPVFAAAAVLAIASP